MESITNFTSLIKDVFNSNNINNLYNRFTLVDHDYRSIFNVTVSILSLFNFLIAVIIVESLLFIRLKFLIVDIQMEIILCLLFCIILLLELRLMRGTYAMLKAKYKRLEDKDKELIIQPKFMKNLWWYITLVIVRQVISLCLAYILLSIAGDNGVVLNKFPIFSHITMSMAYIMLIIIIIVKLLIAFKLLLTKKNRYRLVRMLNLRVEKDGRFADVQIDETKIIEIKDGVVYIYETKGGLEYAFSLNYLLDISIDYKVRSLK